MLHDRGPRQPTPRRALAKSQAFSRRTATESPDAGTRHGDLRLHGRNRPPHARLTASVRTRSRARRTPGEAVAVESRNSEPLPRKDSAFVRSVSLALESRSQCEGFAPLEAALQAQPNASSPCAPHYRSAHHRPHDLAVGERPLALSRWAFRVLASKAVRESERSANPSTLGEELEGQVRL